MKTFPPLTPFFIGSFLAIASALALSHPSAFADDKPNAHSDAEKYREIAGTASPDGQFALALGLAQKTIIWENIHDTDRGGYLVAQDRANILNYVVDIKAHRILGVTGVKYYGTNDHYNHESIRVAWSPDSSIYIQIMGWKWFTDCRAGRIKGGRELAGTVDLQSKAKAFADQFLKKTQPKNYPAGIDDYSVDLGVNKLNNDGTMELDVSGQIPKTDSDFEVIEHLRLTKDLRVELVDIKFVPQTQ